MQLFYAIFVQINIFFIFVSYYAAYTADLQCSAVKQLLFLKSKRKQMKTKKPVKDKDKDNVNVNVNVKDKELPPPRAVFPRNKLCGKCGKC